MLPGSLFVGMPTITSIRTRRQATSLGAVARPSTYMNPLNQCSPLGPRYHEPAPAALGAQATFTSPARSKLPQRRRGRILAQPPADNHLHPPNIPGSSARRGGAAEHITNPLTNALRSTPGYHEPAAGGRHAGDLYVTCTFEAAATEA